MLESLRIIAKALVRSKRFWAVVCATALFIFLEDRPEWLDLLLYQLLLGGF
jgi:hypothetical protein